MGDDQKLKKVIAFSYVPSSEGILNYSTIHICVMNIEAIHLLETVPLKMSSHFEMVPVDTSFSTDPGPFTCITCNLFAYENNNR